MRDISVLGIDIAKHVFYLHGVDKRGYRIKGSDKQAGYICAAYSYFSDVTFS